MDSRQLCFVPMLLASFASLAAGVTMKDTGSYWLCKAYDSKNNQWIAKSPYRRVAMNTAYEGCKKQSQFPKTCKTANEYCEDIIKGGIAQHGWQCTAMDKKAKSWVSDAYPERNQAVLGAKAYCEKHSDIPNSCYVNLLTCKNLQTPGE